MKLMMDKKNEKSPARINNGPTEFAGGPPSLSLDNGSVEHKYTLENVTREIRDKKDQEKRQNEL